jgi:hypothetical protein
MPGLAMLDDPQSLFGLLSSVGVTQPALVLQRGRRYWRVEDLLKQARKDLKRGDESIRKALSDPLYTLSRDQHGKVSIRDASSGTIMFSEVGAEELAPPLPGDK